MRDEAYRIASEALRNAFRHAQARRITVGDYLRQAAVPLACVAMTERALDEEIRPAGGSRQALWLYTACASGLKIVGGRLEVRSRVDWGTEVELVARAILLMVGLPGGRGFQKYFLGEVRDDGGTDHE